MLGQSEMTILVDPRLPSKIYQGITTEVTGEGGSAAPLNDAIIEADALVTSITKSLRIGAHSANILPDWKNRASVSTSPVTWARRRCAAWSSATTTSSPLRRNSNR